MHAWPFDDPAGASRYTRVTFFSDYVVWAMSKFSRWRNFQDYEFMSPGPALQRGFGFCSQKSRIVFSVLLDNGYWPVMKANPEHVVIEVDGTVIDADYGVFVPYSLEALKQEPYLVPFFYAQFQPWHPLLLKVFTEGFTDFSDIETLSGMLAFERELQYLKWQIPIGGIILAFIFGVAGRRLMLSTDRVGGSRFAVGMLVPPEARSNRFVPQQAE